MLFGRKMRAAVWRWLKRLEVARRYRQDVRQDIFLGALQSFYTYDPHRARPERWLNRIVVHIASRHRQRAVHRREELRQDFSRLRDHTPTAEERLILEERRMKLHRLLAGLDGDLRMILIAHDIEGVPMTAIAEGVGIPLSTAYKWRARALAALRGAIT
ncbi:MAG: RNA polymerase sigma factor [Polyangiaceae bacterium]|nr:RNA polymerase sigma factor [Polyangiaceae bacterium]